MPLPTLLAVGLVLSGPPLRARVGPRSLAVELVERCQPRPLLVVRDGDDVRVGEALEAKLGRLEHTSCEQAVSRIKAAAPGSISAVFELQFDGLSTHLAQAATECGVDLYRYQAGAAAFQRVAGEAGPSWLTAEPSFEKVAECKGLGFIGDDRYGDDDLALDVSKLSDVQLAKFLGLPPPSLEDISLTDTDSLPMVSELGYALCAGAELVQLAQGLPFLTSVARDVLIRRGTEPPRSWLLADGTKYEPNAQGMYLCALSGVPLYGSDSVLPSRTGWPSFRAYADPDPLAQHVRTTKDMSSGEVRLELLDAQTGAHLGHRLAARRLYVASYSMDSGGGQEWGGTNLSTGRLSSILSKRRPACPNSPELSS